MVVNLVGGNDPHRFHMHIHPPLKLQTGIYFTGAQNEPVASTSVSERQNHWNTIFTRKHNNGIFTANQCDFCSSLPGTGSEMSGFTSASATLVSFSQRSLFLFFVFYDRHPWKGSLTKIRCNKRYEILRASSPPNPPDPLDEPLRFDRTRGVKNYRSSYTIRNGKFKLFHFGGRSVEN